MGRSSKPGPVIALTTRPSSCQAFNLVQVRLLLQRVFGNPPWGGVLKGPLAPVYDSAKKKHFALRKKVAARGAGSPGASPRLAMRA
jgi:hypothetical protein